MVASFYWRLFIPGAFDRWELIQAQELHKKLRIKQNLQQLNSDISDITTWLKKTDAELETFKMAEPPSDMREMELRVKRLKEILKAFDTYKALVVSVNLSSREFLQTGGAESRELQDRVGQLRLHWDTAQGAVDSWREGLQQSLMQCQVRRPQPAPQAHVGGRSRYFYHRAAFV